MKPPNGDGNVRQKGLGFEDNADGRNDGDGGRGNSSSNDNNVLVLSLYLIESQDDLLLQSGDSSGDDDVGRRARLYRRLCRACSLANDILLRSSSSPDVDEGGEGSDPGRRGTDRRRHYRPWSSGGDGPVFGVHCRDNADDEYSNANNDVDGDDAWQSQSPTEHSSAASTSTDVNRELANVLCDRGGGRGGSPFLQPHLRALCRYGNDVDDAWRAVSLCLEISLALSSRGLRCAVECWDADDGHLLLIEAAGVLPNWVDDDAAHGGAGGPRGCRERCWIVDGEVRLVPPTPDDDGAAGALSRGDALRRLTMESTARGADGGAGTPATTTCALEAVQRAVRNRIDRALEDHWHAAAAALPASVARFLEERPSLAPLLVDSFCEGAPAHLRGERESENGNGRRGGEELGALFPYERLVTVPVRLTRANYAELISGRGKAPSFPLPPAYRSVELNRLRRRLRQWDDYDVEGVEEGGGCARRRKRKNPFERAVDVGARLCAGLEWIASGADDDVRKASGGSTDDAATRSLGEVERRLRVHWTRIDAEARGVGRRAANSDLESSLPWTERAWRAGPNGGGNGAAISRDETLALESMSGCRVFRPELSGTEREEPCPCTRAGASLRRSVRSGVKDALRRRRDDDDSRFPMPKSGEVDDDGWMEVNSLEELEEEMRRNSSRSDSRTGDDAGPKGGRPRRTTRRSRRNVAGSGDGEGKDRRAPRSSADGVLRGIRSFVEGEGDPEGALTGEDVEEPSPTKTDVRSEGAGRPPRADVTPEELASRGLNVDPRKFLQTLHAMLSEENTPPATETFDDADQEQKEASYAAADASEYFFEEDLDVGDASDDDSGSDEDDSCDREPGDVGAGEDPWSLQNIMGAMDHELRIGEESHPSVKNLSVASEEGDDDVDLEALSNLLRSIDAQDECGGSGPATTILRGMGILPPRSPIEDDGKMQ